MGTPEQHPQAEQQKRVPPQESPQSLPVNNIFLLAIVNNITTDSPTIEVSDSFSKLATWTEAACAGLDTLRSPEGDPTN